MAFVDKSYNTHLKSWVLNARVVLYVHILRFLLRGIFILKQAQMRILQLSDSLHVP